MPNGYRPKSFIDMTGKKYGQLTAIEYLGKGEWLFECDCGNIITSRGINVRTGTVKSCGCMKSTDITGNRYGRLVVIQRHGSDKSGSTWLCKCDCGNTKVVSRTHLVTGDTKSCGCMQIENQKYGSVIHGCTHEKLFGVWASMKNRCFNSNVPAYKYYGGRGIYVCDEWRHNYSAFREWSFANGYVENEGHNILTIDRIDNDGPYAPWNCRWVDMKTQNNNKRNNRNVGNVT